MIGGGFISIIQPTIVCMTDTMDGLTVVVSDGPVLVEEGHEEEPQLLGHVAVVHSKVVLKYFCFHTHFCCRLGRYSVR